MAVASPIAYYDTATVTAATNFTVTSLETLKFAIKGQLQADSKITLQCNFIRYYSIFFFKLRHFRQFVLKYQPCKMPH